MIEEDSESTMSVLLSSEDDVESKKSKDDNVVKEPNYLIPGMIIFPLTFFILSVYITNNADQGASMSGIIFLAFMTAVSVTAIAIFALFKANNPSPEHKTSKSISEQLRPAQPRDYNPIIKTQKINGVTRQIAYYNPNIKVGNDRETIQNWSYIGIALGFVSFVMAVVYFFDYGEDACIGFCGLGTVILILSGMNLFRIEKKSGTDWALIVIVILVVLQIVPLLFMSLTESW